MNCDEVFVILTRGPFPSGSPHDRRVEVHLQKCIDCQRLAEALRPNDDGFHESIGLDDGGALPGYWGEPLGAASDLAVSLSDAAEKSNLTRAPLRNSRGSQAHRNLNAWQFAAAVALGIVLAAALRTLVTGHPNRARFLSTHEAGDTSSDARRWIADNREEQPSLLYPAVCRGVDSPDATKSLAPISLADLPAQVAARCCTDCHHAGSETKISEAAKVRLEHSCRACHVAAGR